MVETSGFGRRTLHLWFFCKYLMRHDFMDSQSMEEVLWSISYVILLFMVVLLLFIPRFLRWFLGENAFYKTFSRFRSRLNANFWVRYVQGRTDNSVIIVENWFSRLYASLDRCRISAATCSRSRVLLDVCTTCSLHYIPVGTKPIALYIKFSWCSFFL